MVFAIHAYLLIVRPVPHQEKSMMLIHKISIKFILKIFLFYININVEM